MGQKSKKAGSTKHRNRTCDKPAQRTKVDYLKQYVPKWSKGKALTKVLRDIKDGGDLIDKVNELTEDDEHMTYMDTPPHLSVSAFDKKRYASQVMFPKTAVGSY